jgi:uncharacterized membrane protein
MEPTIPAPGTPTAPPKLNEVGALRALTHAIRARIISGLILALPIVLTFWIIYWLYTTLRKIVLDPLAGVIDRVLIAQGLVGFRGTWYETVTPLIAIVLVLALLYVLGLFVQSRALRVFDLVLLRVPVVTTIYKALSNVIKSLGNQVQNQQFKRVVLVEFPHAGARALGFVTNSVRDVATGRTILCVCVLTGVMPPAGFTLFVPEEDVTDLDWSVNQTLQAILSGGITLPASIGYFRVAGAPLPGHLIDTYGRPIDHPVEAPGPPAS